MLIAGVLILPLMLVACSEGQLLAPEDAQFSFIGFEGSTDGVTPSSTSVAHDFAFPSTNAINIEKGWANVTWNAADAGVGEAPLKFTQPRTFIACFEYRVDNEDPYYPDADNFNAHITDGLWRYTCVSNNEAVLNLTATSHVDVRLTFGAEGDERFDWTRFYVMTALSKDDCRKGGWEALGFENQGQCIRFVETGKDSRTPLPPPPPVPDAEGDVVWTSGGSNVQEYRTEFAIFAAGTGTVYTVRTSEMSLNWSYTVTCVRIEGNQAWFGGTRDSDSAFVIFYAQDATPDKFNQWTNNTAGHSCANLGSWSAGMTVTEGSLTIR
jgi:hypothetical protein